MSDIKRIALTTFEPQKVSDKQSKKAVKTIRISVILPESNEDNCPEYNYKDELAAVKKRAKLKDKKETNNVENGLDPFGDDDEDVRRIALQMEEKYGNIFGGGNKKKRKGRKDDYADIGMGYDESDPFIDNTDGYDEIIPQNVTTLHGGFYINSGALEFKTDDEATSDLSSSSDSDNDTITENKSVNRKRILETSDEEEGDEDGKDSHAEKKLKLANKNNMQQAIKKKLFSQNKIQVKKRRPIDPIKRTVKELLREKREDLNMSVPQDLIVEGEGVLEKDSLKENKKPMSISSVADAIESVVKATLPQKSEFDNNANSRTLEINSSITKTDVSLSYDGESSHDSKSDKIEVKLPENLPADILELINSIKRAAFENKDGKVKFFTEEVNQKFLRLERLCRCLGKTSKAKVYDHLSPFVGSKKETLMRRAKNLVLEDELKKLPKLIVGLKNGIDEVMPLLKANHEKESQRILQKKFSQDSITNEETKSLRMPHRKFQWSEELRKLLKDIVATKKRVFLLEGKQKDSLDELILLYLKSDIQGLWPEGWMSVAALRKACNIDNPVKKTEKPIDSGTKVQELSKSASKPLDVKHVGVHNDTTKHSLKNPSLTLNNSNLQIIPVPNNVGKNSNSSSRSESVASDITVSKVSSNNIVKASQKLPEKPATITPSLNSQGEKRVEVEEHKFFDFSKTIQLLETSIQSVDKSVIVSAQKPKEETHHRLPEVKKETYHRLPEVKKETYHKIPEAKKETYHMIPEAKKETYHKIPDAKKETYHKIPEAKKEVHHRIPEAKKEVHHRIPEVKESNAVIVEPKHCQVIDLTDHSSKKKSSLPKSKPLKLVDFAKISDQKMATVNDIQPKPAAFVSKSLKLTEYLKGNDVLPMPVDFSKEPMQLTNKPADLTIMTNYRAPPTLEMISDGGDDIQKVMENLKALEKMASPSKSSENSISSPVSVIAYNKSFSPKSSNSNQSRSECKPAAEFGSGFQDEFQKQFISSLSHMSTPTSSKTTYNRCS